MLNCLFAMAGLAEAAFAQQLLFCWAGLIVIGAFLIAAGVRRSQEMFVFVIGLSIFFGAIFEPWIAFQAVSGKDPDLVYWVSRYRAMSGVWLVMFVIAVVLFLFLLFQSGRREAPVSQP